MESTIYDVKGQESRAQGEEKWREELQGNGCRNSRLKWRLNNYLLYQIKNNMKLFDY